MSENKFPFTPAETNLLINAAREAQTLDDIQTIFSNVMDTLMKWHTDNALPRYSTGMSSACSTVVVLDTKNKPWKTAFNAAVNGSALPKIAHDLLNTHAALLEAKGLNSYQDWLHTRNEPMTTAKTAYGLNRN